MYIGVGTLFCVTLPDEIRYGIGDRMCAPSMPLPSEPSTRLSRVVPHDACFCTSTSGMPYLAKMPFSFATNSGDASVKAMKPSLAPFTSGPAVCAKAPPGKFSRAAASNAAVPAPALSSARRLILTPVVPCFVVFVIVSVVLSTVLLPGSPRYASPGPPPKKQKAAPEAHRCELLRTAALLFGSSRTRWPSSRPAFIYSRTVPLLCDARI